MNSSPSSHQSTNPSTDVSPLAALLNSTYPAVKRDHPSEGRRRWRLRIAAAFWSMDPQAQASTAAQASSTSPSTDLPEEDDEDPWDAYSTDAPGLGLLVRTDFTDESAWQAFSARLRDAEAEIAGDEDAAINTPGAGRGAEDTSMDVEDDGDDGGDSSDDEGPGGRPPVFTVINPAGNAEKRALSGISNLTALRLLCDVDIRRAPHRPDGARPVDPPNRLVDRGGFQEIYDGKGVWIYDARSNADQSVRVVSLQGDVYGTATADSWRARVGHICELQLNMAMGAMKIDFGGLDRWDHIERQRNMAEAEAPFV